MARDYFCNHAKGHAVGACLFILGEAYPNTATFDNAVPVVTETPVFPDVMLFAQQFQRHKLFDLLNYGFHRYANGGRNPRQAGKRFHFRVGAFQEVGIGHEAAGAHRGCQNVQGHLCEPAILPSHQVSVGQLVPAPSPVSFPHQLFFPQLPHSPVRALLGQVGSRRDFFHGYVGVSGGGVRKAQQGAVGAERVG